MTRWRWTVIISLCKIVIALVEGEKFDSIEASVQYSDELGNIKAAIHIYDRDETEPNE